MTGTRRPRKPPLPVGRTTAAAKPKGCRGGKSGLHGNTVPGNARRGRPQGKCHRKQTARAFAPRVRVKGWGKSPPRSQQWERHGKPHREQDRIGATRAQAQPVSRFVARVGRERRPVTGVPDEWSSRGGSPPPYRTRLTGRLAILPSFLAFGAARELRGGRLRRARPCPEACLSALPALSLRIFAAPSACRVFWRVLGKATEN